MKKNADIKELRDIDEVINYAIDTIATWTEDRIKNIESEIEYYVHDTFIDYELTDDEFSQVCEMVVDFFDDEEDYVEDDDSYDILSSVTIAYADGLK